MKALVLRFRFVLRLSFSFITRTERLHEQACFFNINGLLKCVTAKAAHDIMETFIEVLALSLYVFVNVNKLFNFCYICKQNKSLNSGKVKRTIYSPLQINNHVHI